MVNPVPDSVQAAFQHCCEILEMPAPHAPHTFQIATAEALLAGRRVVLRAPAGSGKTLAAWLPWIAARQYPYDFPARMLHILPGGTLFGEMHRKLLALADSVKAQVGIQTEGEALDPFLLSNAVITTNDQLLSMALHRPLGLYPGLANINAGAVLGAYLVFDEFPAFAAPEALATWLGLLRAYCPMTPCLFTTGVMPPALAARIATSLDAEFIDAGDFPAGGQRTWAAMPALNVEAILRQHRRRTIIICNTVRGAQTLYRALRRTPFAEEGGCELLLLHQYQLYRDRLPIEERARAIFGQRGEGKAILVTTSGVKVAADLSADTLITDPTLPDKLLQRVGRCGRFDGAQGRVIVARVSEEPPGVIYPSPGGEQLVSALADGAPKRFADELSVYTDLLTSAPPEQQPPVLHELPTDAELDALPHELLACGVEAFPERLFSRVSVCLHLVPESVQDPFALERFSLAVSSLERGWKQWRASGCHGEWFALIPHWAPNAQGQPSWSLVESPQEFRAAARLIALNADAVSYDPIIGLELAPGTPYQSDRLRAQQISWSPFDQHVEPFCEHATRVLEAFDHQLPWYRYVLRHLGRRWGLPAVELEQWLRLCILWHDAGKLTITWQRAARRWQAEVMRRPVGNEMLARVDFQESRHGNYPCPPHAPVAGMALARCLPVVTGPRGDLFRGTLAAISHHHGIVPGENMALEPDPEAWSTLIDLAAQVLDTRQVRRMDRVGWAATPRGLDPVPARPPAEPDAWMAYSLLVRAIRLADREVALAQLLG